METAAKKCIKISWPSVRFLSVLGGKCGCCGGWRISTSGSLLVVRSESLCCCSGVYTGLNRLTIVIHGSPRGIRRLRGNFDEKLIMKFLGYERWFNVLLSSEVGLRKDS